MYDTPLEKGTAMIDHKPTLRQKPMRMSASDPHQRGPELDLAAAAIMLIGAALVFWVIEAISASAWKTPVYSYASNWISDLGVPHCGPFQGREICSRLHNVMNTGFIVEGMLSKIKALQ